MGLTVPHGIAYAERVQVVAQSVIGTPVAPAATDAVRVLKTSFSRKLDRKSRLDKKEGRNIRERWSGRITANWSIEKFLMPSGTRGTAPDDGLLMTAAVGREVVTPATSVDYSNPGGNVVPNILSIVRSMPYSVLEHAVGCFVEEMKINLSGDDAAKVTYSGPCRDIVRTGGTITVPGGASAGASSVTVDTDQGIRTYIGALIQFENGTSYYSNSGAGYTVTNIVGDVISVSPVLEGNIAAGADVYAFMPANTNVGIPIDGSLGSLTIAGTTTYIQAAEIVLKNNILQEMRYGSAYLDDVAWGRQSVTGKIDMLLRRDQAHLLVEKGTTFADKALVFTSGTANGYKTIVSIPYAEFDTHDLEIPEGDDIAKISVPFVAHGTGVGDNAITVQFA